MNGYKKIVKDRYSSSFNQVILSLIEIDPKYRTKISKVYESLKPHAGDIEELRSFIVNENGMKESQAYSMVPAEGSGVFSKSRV